MFKKKKINKKTKNKIYVNIVGLIAIFIVFFIAFFVFNSLKSINISWESNDIVNNTWSVNKIFDFSNLFKVISLVWIKKYDNNENSEQEIKETSKINVLLVWRWWWDHDAPNLTDSIILVSINKVYKTITMLSIPRDLYVTYSSWDEGKINEVYALARFETWKNKDWMDALSEKITQITWEKIDYYVNIDFKGFSSFIDSLGWVTIDVPETLYDDSYPDWNYWYRTLIIKKWTWNFDWDTALMYARSRHSTSDFDRSLRQQQILTAVRDKLNEWWFLSKLYKAKNFYDIFTKYVDTDLDLSWIVNIFNEIKDSSNYEILSYNLNDSCFFDDPNCQKGWFLYVPERALFWWASILLANWAYKWNIDNYTEIKKFTNMIFNHSNLYKEKVQINIFNATKNRWIAWDLAVELKRYWFEVPDKNSIWNARDKIYNTSIMIYDDSIKDSYTLDFLKSILWLQSIQRETYSPVYSVDENTQLEIILWNNYMDVLDNLDNNL